LGSDGPTIFGGEWDLHLTRCRLGPTSVPSGILLYPGVFPQQTLSENRGTAYLTQCGRGRDLTHYVPSFILIHQVVSPQYTNVTDRTDRTTVQ